MRNDIKVCREVSKMRFIREIPQEKIKNEIFQLEQFGFTLVWRIDSVEIWVEVA